MIFHIVPLADWTASPGLPYAPPSLASEGFVHCSADRPTALAISDAHYRGVRGTLLAVELDEGALTADVRREGDSGDRYPHVHGPLNREAVIHVWEVVRTPGSPASLAPWQPGTRNGAADSAPGPAAGQDAARHPATERGEQS